MSYLGLCNFCRRWIPECALLAEPLQNLVYGKNLALTDKIEWTPQAGFVNIFVRRFSVQKAKS